ncbi:MAG: A24 family peptidase [Candidatus Nanoarchaeia archaeon]|nr:A24 family peptidase [Candidatus Nanoarchaeia archaeon]
MIEELILTTSFIYLLITSILDIKYRLVWDYINYSFGFLFLLIRLTELIITANFSIFLGVVLASIATFVIGLILYKTGAWGGGDLKLLTALSIGLFFLPSDKLSVLSLSFPFYANFLINTLFSGIIFGLAWSYFLLIKTKTYKKLKKFHIIILLISLILFISIFFVQVKEKILFSLLIVFSLYYIIKIYEDKITLVNKDVKKLDEGDWIFKNININGKLVTKKPTGLSKEDIKILQSSKYKIIKIKDGIPFLVSFFLAFIITIILNDNLMKIIVMSL